MSLPDVLPVAESFRLSLRRFDAADAPFVLALVNDPGWLRFIGDRHVHDEAAARTYIEEKLVDQYRRLGFGLYLVTRKSDSLSLGMCGLVKRPALDDVDLGFAFLPAYRGAGYAREAARAVLQLAHQQFKLPRVAAITAPTNSASIRLLEALQFKFVDRRLLDGYVEESSYFVHTF